MDKETVTFTYVVKDELYECQPYQESSLMESISDDYTRSETIALKNVQAIWYEPKAKPFFAKVGKVCAFTGLILAPLVSIQKDGQFNTKRYYPLLGLSAAGAVTSFRYVFLI